MKKRKPLPPFPEKGGRKNGIPYGLRVLDWFGRGEKAGYTLDELGEACPVDLAELVAEEPKLRPIAAGLGLVEAAPGASEAKPARAARKGRQDASPASPAPAAGVPIETERKYVRPDELRPHPENPRTTFDVSDLVESVRQFGVLEAILCRPHPDGQGYQIVAGERRWRAATAAKLPLVKVDVARMTDELALEIMLIENVQRQDLSPGCVADGYARLLAAGMTTEAIAARIGKSVSTVRDLLRISRGLPPEVRAALDRGEVTASVAALVARVPPGEPRDKLVQWLLAGERVWHPAGFGGDEQVPWSFRRVKERIRSECTVELKQAPFSLKTVDLNEPAGSCEQCPKRVGNLARDDPDGYDGLRADVCTDPSCYRLKVEHWRKRQLADAEVKGQTVLGPDDSARVFKWGGTQVPGDAKYFDLAATCEQDRAKKQPRTFAKLLDGELDEKDVVLATDGRGQLHRLVPRSVAEPILRHQHGLYPLGSGKNGTPPTKADAAQLERENRIKRARHEALLAALTAAATAAFEPLARAPGSAAVLLRVLVGEAIYRSGGLVVEDTCRRRELGAKSTTAAREALGTLADTLGPVELAALLAELFVGGDVLYAPRSRLGAEGLKLLGIDRERLDAAAAAGAKEAAGRGKDRAAKGPAAAEADPMRGPYDWALADLGLPCGLAEAQLMPAGYTTVEDLTGAAVREEVGLSDLLTDMGLSLADASTVADTVSQHLLGFGIQSCRTCGCTEEDCFACMEKTGVPCTWAEERLCSACAGGKEGP